MQHSGYSQTPWHKQKTVLEWGWIGIGENTSLFKLILPVSQYKVVHFTFGIWICITLAGQNTPVARLRIFLRKSSPAKSMCCCGKHRIGWWWGWSTYHRLHGLSNKRCTAWLSMPGLAASIGLLILFHKALI